MYYYDENFMLPLSHDEVVHGNLPCYIKCQAMNSRNLPTSGLCVPTCLRIRCASFIGDEFGATNEWNHKSELQWYLLKYELHMKMKDYVQDLICFEE
jgi:1,4-alpha-glucan branching enzyme